SGGLAATRSCLLLRLCRRGRLERRLVGRRGLLRRLPGVRHAALRSPPRETARAPWPSPARVAHAPPLRRRSVRLRGECALVGCRFPHVLAARPRHPPDLLISARQDAV